MRRSLFLILAGAVALVIALSGCGSSSTGASPSPLSTTLSYFPAQTPFVLMVATKPSAHATAQEKQLEQRLPLVSFGKSAIMGKLKQLGIDYNQDLKPLFGNPVAIGDPSTSISAFQSNFLIAWVTKDESKLSALLKKLGGLTAAGTHDGAKLYNASGSALAVAGSTVVFAKNIGAVTSALDRHAHGGGVTPSQYSNAVAGLPSDAAVHIFGDLRGALSTPQAATARKVPWVAALRGYGATFGSSSSGLTTQFRLDTGGVTLSPSQLPFATGTTPAKVVAGLPIQVGIRNPSQIVGFIEGAMQAADPQAYAKFLKQQAKVRRRTGVDVNTLVSQFQGNLVVDSDTRTTLVRAGVGDPGTVTKLLSKLGSAHGGLGGKTSLKPRGGGLYAFAPSGRDGLLAVIGNQLVFGVAPRGGHMSAAALRSFAAAPGAPLPGASGALSFRVSLAQLLALTARSQTTSALGHQILSLLGDFSGSMAITPAALTGNATLAIK